MNKIAIIGPWDYNYLCAVMDKLIEESQYFLFDVICGGTEESVLFQSVGYRWAVEHGAPVYFLIAETVDKLIEKLVKDVDFAVIMNDGSRVIKKIIMELSIAGKHGRVEI